jgi:hydrogenase 3 maturation protease
MKKNLLLAVGNWMMGDDAVGPLLAQKMQEEPIDGWEVMNCGSTPENYLHKIRELAPRRVLIVDASDMDLKPGDIRRIGADKIDDPFLMTTHALPLSYLIHSLEEFVPEVEMVGVQPEIVAFGYPISDKVVQAVGVIFENLKLECQGWQDLH